jgi:hypothetical protein
VRGGERLQRRGDVPDVGERQDRRPVAGRRDRFEQLADRYREGAGQSDQNVRPGVGFTELDAADVFVLQAGQLCQRLLRHLPIEAETAQLRAERPEYGRTRGSLIGNGLPGGHRLLCTAQPWS